MQKKRVLIITAKSDVHCDYVSKVIQDLGHETIRLNTEDIAYNSSFDINISENNINIYYSILDSNIEFTPNDIFSIWYRKPEPVLTKGFEHEYSAQKFVEDEYNFFLKSFYDLLKDKFWVNHYWANRIASQKLPNLKLANKLGLKTPETLVTNNPLEAENFCKKYNFEVSVKTFGFSGFATNQGNHYMCYAQKITKKNFHKFKNSISLAPVLLQNYIEKEIELRVTIMGNRIFTAGIYSQQSEQSKYDFRAIDPYEIKHIEYQLPKEIETKLLLFNKHYHLNFSTFDIILDKERNYIFLECNPNGQWLWLEDVTNMKMCEGMANLLLNKI